MGLAAILGASVASADPTVVISEFMDVNNTTPADEDGTYSDWIELFNSNTNTVNLGGWYLSDKATNLTHWMFPATNLGPSQFLVVFASNKNRRVAGAGCKL
jgi:Lamin Tail Domain